MSNADREAFEAWAKDHGWDIRRIDNPSGFIEFISHNTMQMWLGWQDARAHPDCPFSGTAKAFNKHSRSEIRLLAEADYNRGYAAKSDLKLEITLSGHQADMVEKLVRLGNYGESPEMVIEYLVKRGLDDMLRSPGLKDYLRNGSRETRR